MASIQLADATASALADAITTLVDAGAGAGTIKVYTGTLPVDLDPTADTLLATFTLVDPAAAAAAAGVATWDFSPAIDATVAATGTAGWFLIEDSTGVDVFGGDVGTSGASMNFSSVSWVSGGTVSLTAGTVTEPTS
jgi:hypothetical protein